MKFISCFYSLIFLLLSFPTFAVPDNFSHAKVLSKRHVYFDQEDKGSFYCGCKYQFTGKSGGRVDLESCGYGVRKNANRASRIEWEHIVPASNFGRARQCWQEGGRKNCTKSDPVFSVMEADLHNLTPAIGEVNGDRSNYNFGAVSGVNRQYGQCDFKVDFKNRIVEPRDEVKGRIARVYFYMFDRYDLRMSTQQQRLLMSWHKQYPVGEWELERNARIQAIVGHDNEFVTGKRTWELGHKNSRDGLRANSAKLHTVLKSQNANVKGNRNSKVYHLPEGCPSYNNVSEKNIVNFESEADAVEAGFRKAGNCR